MALHVGEIAILNFEDETNKQICQRTLVCDDAVVPLCLVPFAILSSPPEVDLERTYSEPTAKLRCVMDDVVVCVLYRPSVIVIPKRAKIRVPLLRKKSGTKWDMMTITITIGICTYTPSEG